MGLDIKRNKNGEFKLISTISDESYHPEKEWISLSEAKKIFINKALWGFIEKAIEIDMTFPNNYMVNDKICRDEKPDFNQFILDCLRKENGDELITKKFEEVYKQLDLNFQIP